MCNTENRKYTYQGLFCKAIMKTANRTILRELPCFCFEVCAASEKQLCKLNRKIIACQFLPVLKKQPNTQESRQDRLMPKKILCDKQKHCKKECPFPQTKIPPALYGAVFPISCFFCRTIGLFPTRHIQKRAESCIAASLRYDSVSVGIMTPAASLRCGKVGRIGVRS